MKVCDCMDVEYETILEVMKELQTTDIDAIAEESEAGITCECCREEDCDIVDLPLPLAIKKAAEELGL